MRQILRLSRPTLRKASGFPVRGVYERGEPTPRLPFTFTFQLSDADGINLKTLVIAITQDSPFVRQNHRMERTASSLHYQ